MLKSLFKKQKTIQSESTTPNSESDNVYIVEGREVIEGDAKYNKYAPKLNYSRNELNSDLLILIKILPSEAYNAFDNDYEEILPKQPKYQETINFDIKNAESLLKNIESLNNNIANKKQISDYIKSISNMNSTIQTYYENGQNAILYNYKSKLDRLQARYLALVDDHKIMLNPKKQKEDMTAAFKNLLEIITSFKKNKIKIDPVANYYIKKPTMLKEHLDAGVKPITVFKSHLEALLEYIDTIYEGLIEQYKIRNLSGGSKKTKTSRKIRKSKKSKKTTRKY